MNKTLPALLGSALTSALCLTASAQTQIESVTFDGVLPEISLSSSFFPNEPGFEFESAPITGLPKFDPSLGTLTAVLLSFGFDYETGAEIFAEGILDEEFPHQAEAFLDQFAIGVAFARADGGTGGLVNVEFGFGLGCFGEPFEGFACSDGFFDSSSFGAFDADLFGSVATEDVVGSGDVEILTVVIDHIDAQFNLDNVGFAELAVFTEIVPESTSVSITYVYETDSNDPDTDGDGVTDSNDSCINVPNPDQTDGDGDGYGNACDTDLNNDCVTNAVDLGLLRVGFFGTDPALDFNNDGIVNVGDLGAMRLAFFGTPGPSGLTSFCD